jgi:hypothetical protein
MYPFASWSLSFGNGWIVNVIERTPADNKNQECDHHDAILQGLGEQLQQIEHMMCLEATGYEAIHEEIRPFGYDCCKQCRREGEREREREREREHDYALMDCPLSDDGQPIALRY